jgi:hypothetical protein
VVTAPAVANQRAADGHAGDDGDTRDKSDFFRTIR